MKSTNISQLKNNLSRLLAYVRRGGTVRVFDRDAPVADLVPCRPPETTDATDALLAGLVRDGVLVRATSSLPADFLSRRLPRPKVSVLRALLDERSETR